MSTLQSSVSYIAHQQNGGVYAGVGLRQDGNEDSSGKEDKRLVTGRACQKSRH